MSPRISTLSSQDRCLPLPVAISSTPSHPTLAYNTISHTLYPYHTIPCHVICQIISLSHSGIIKKNVDDHLPTYRCDAPFHSFVVFASGHFIPSSAYIPFLLSSPLFLGPSPFRMPLWPRPKNSLSSFFIQTAIASRCRSRFVNFNCFRPL